MPVEIKGVRIPGLMVKFDPGMAYGENLGALQKKLSSGLAQGKSVIVSYEDDAILPENKSHLDNLFQKYNSRILGYKIEHPPAKIQPVPGAADERESPNNAPIVSYNLRGGQTINHDGDVIVIGNINPGAEVKASGSIFVFGILKGSVHAGWPKNTDAVVVANQLLPQRLWIAGLLMDQVDEQLACDHPEKAYIHHEQIYVEQI